jgi:hypothetical protein
MNLVRLFADLQTYPRKIATYRKIVDELKRANRIHEAEAFESLINSEFYADTHSDEEQRENDP